MDNVVSYAEFEYRRNIKDMEKYRRIAERIMDNQESFFGRQPCELKIEAWLENRDPEGAA